jgi:MFS family permease
VIIPYRRLFAAPGAAAFEAAGFAARMAHLMTVLSVVFLISAVTGSYGLGGAVAAAYAVAYSVTSPLISRLVDRHGQGRVLTPVTAANTASRAGFLAAVWLGAPAWSLLALSALSGATMPAIGPLVRARWSHLFSGSALLEAALSLESVVDDTILVTAPIAVSVLATSLSPAAGLIIALLFAAGGSGSLATQRRTEPPARPTGRRAGTALAVPGFLPLLMTFAAVGTAQTIIDIAVVTFSAAHGTRELSGLILAAVALASACSGLWYGARRWRAAPEERLLAALALFAGGTLLFVAGGSIWFLFLAAAVIGLAVAPAMIAGFSIVSRTVPEHQRTEGLTWLTAAVGLGISAGSASVGGIVDRWGTRPAFALAAGCAAAAILAAAAVRARRTAGTRRSARRPGRSSRWPVPRR